MFAVSAVSLNLSEAQLSDLFFNHQHPTYDALFRGGDDEGPTREQMESAILEDAKQFVSDFDIPESPEALTADYMKRL